MTTSQGVSDAPRPRRTMRSIGAVVAGFVAVFVLSSATDAVLHATNVYPPYPQRMADSLFIVATAYRIVFAIIGGYITARLAPDRPVWHALILGVVGTVVAIAGAAAMWSYGPAWYSIALIVTAIPCCWAGGKLYAR